MGIFGLSVSGWHDDSPGEDSWNENLMTTALTKSPAAEVSGAELAQYLEFAKSAAVSAGEETLPYFRRGVDVDNKLDGGRFDPVTEGDRKAERTIREMVKQTYPDHGVFGEEYGAGSGNGLTWVIDPIDGTRAFMTGMVHWGVLLALFDGQRPILGVMRQPFTQETFFSDGSSSFYQKGAAAPQSLQTTKTAVLAEAIVGSTGPHLYASDSELTQFMRLQNQSRMTRYGGDCYMYAMLAMGFFDVVADPGLNAYDIQALMPIIEGAGGCVSTWSGGDASLGGAIVASANSVLHEQVLRCLAATGTG